jgi:hypothetical protein
MARKTMSIQIEQTLQESFKQKCKDNSLKYSDVVEALLQSYVDGKVDVRVEMKYTVTPKTL